MTETRVDKSLTARNSNTYELTQKRRWNSSQNTQIQKSV